MELKELQICKFSCASTVSEQLLHVGICKLFATLPTFLWLRFPNMQFRKWKRLPSYSCVLSPTARKWNLFLDAVLLFLLTWWYIWILVAFILCSFGVFFFFLDFSVVVVLVFLDGQPSKNLRLFTATSTCAVILKLQWLGSDLCVQFSLKQYFGLISYILIYVLNFMT